MGATYLSMQLRTPDRDAVVRELERVVRQSPGGSLRCYVGAASDGWVPVFPSFVPELEQTAKHLSARFDCLVLMLLSADEDDLYCMTFRGGKQLPWFKIGIGRRRTGNDREKLASKLDALADVCDAASRERLLALLSDTRDVTFSSDLLRALCDAIGVRNAYTSFEYLQRGERDGLDPAGEPTCIQP